MGDSRRSPLTGRLCFPKSNRIRKRWEFRAIQRRGKRITTRDLIVLWREAPAGRGDQIGITVSKKTARRAVVRNRIKRWIREAFRQIRANGDAPPVQLVVIARPSAAFGSYHRIQENLMDALRRVREHRARRRR